MKRTRQPMAEQAGTPAPDVLGHLGDSLHAHGRRYRKRLKRCRSHFSVEAVHDLRVETRRLLAVVELLHAFLPKTGVKKVCRALKERLDMFDQLRDTQVQLIYVEQMIGSLSAASHFHRWLEKRETCSTRDTRKKLKHLKSGRLDRRIKSLEKAVRARRKEMPRPRAFRTAIAAIDRTFARVVRLCDRIVGEDTETIHRTRIAFKKFRYMTEALSPLLPGVTEDHSRALRGYQSMMGDIQDAEVLLTVVDEYICDEKPKPAAARQLRNEVSRRRRWLIRVYLNASGKLRKLWPMAGAAR